MTSKTALIVGASRGLGLGLVEEFHARGWRVIGTERSSGALSRLATQSDRVRAEILDITDRGTGMS